jgi:hypothetical protein
MGSGNRLARLIERKGTKPMRLIGPKQWRARELECLEAEISEVRMQPLATPKQHQVSVPGHLVPHSTAPSSGACYRA